jgi:hypothetical protein
LIWEPFALALLFGLLISAAITFIFVWPRFEPQNADEDADEDPVADPVAGLDGEEE